MLLMFVLCDISMGVLHPPGCLLLTHVCMFYMHLLV
jgi:hypothetical protein